MFESSKQIQQFPKAQYYTPYLQCDFSENVKCFEINLSICKIIILGDLCVGKTSLLNRFCYKIFTSEYKSTIGVDFQTQQIDIIGIPYVLQIWDTAGQERFKCIAQCYYRKAHVIMIVFDSSAIRTLANCKKWLTDALEVTRNGDSPFIFLVGTKRDLLSDEASRSVETIAARHAQMMKAEFWSVSSKTGYNIQNVFCRAAALSFDKQMKLALEMPRHHVLIGTDIISFKKNGENPKNNRCEGSSCINRFPRREID